MKIVRRFEQNQLASREASPVKESLTTAQAVAVPDGFVLVPKKPTREMTMAARANWSGYGEESGRDYDPMWYEVRDVWDAMLAASQPAAGELNQCDGCRAGMPLDGHIHRDAGGHPIMACQSHMYRNVAKEEGQ